MAGFIRRLFGGGKSQRAKPIQSVRKPQPGGAAPSGLSTGYAAGSFKAKGRNETVRTDALGLSSAARSGFALKKLTGT